MLGGLPLFAREGSLVEMPKAISSNLIEAANRAEATSLLIRLGYKVYRPEADDEGEDLVVRLPDLKLVPVQLKARLHVEHHRYGAKGIWMLFPDAPWNSNTRRQWYLVPHDHLFGIMQARHGHAKSFAELKWTTSSPAKAVADLIAAFRLG